MKNADFRRSIPSVDDLMRHPALKDARDTLPHSVLVEIVRDSVASLRGRLSKEQVAEQGDPLAALIDVIKSTALANSRQALQPVINATGIILHTNLGRAPLADRALERMEGASAYTNLEIDLESGKRCRRASHVMSLLAQATGAEAALVVNNCAAATVLVLQTLCAGREAIISRGQLVEIGGGFRLPEVFQTAGALLREVGSTNRTYLRDYETAINASTGAILLVHRSNFSLSGFVTEPSLDELATLARSSHLPIVHDIGSGSLYDLEKFGLNEPSVRASVASGADLCLFSGDKLFGGPQCGIIVGKRSIIDKVKTHPMMRALRTDKITLAALEATIEIHLSGNAFEQVPVLQMISSHRDAIRDRCLKVLACLNANLRENLKVVESESFVGGGSLAGQGLPSYAISIESQSLDQLSRAFRTGTPAILGRISEDQLLLDMRTVRDRDIDPLAQRLNELLGNCGYTTRYPGRVER